MATEREKKIKKLERELDAIKNNRTSPEYVFIRDQDSDVLRGEDFTMMHSFGWETIGALSERYVIVRSCTKDADKQELFDYFDKLGHVNRVEWLDESTTLKVVGQ